MKIPLPLTLLKDSDSLIKVIVNASRTTERRLMINVRAAREFYHLGEINIVGWIRSEENLADGLTKVARCKAQERF